MTLYPRQQLLVLLGLLAAAGAGLAVGQWRRAHPDLVARLEEFDRDPEATTAVLVPEPGGAHPGRPPRAAPPRATPLDVNRASAAELARMPGVSPALAARIVAARERDGPFASVDDLARVRRLGRARLERLRPLLTAAAPAADE
ncbi:MAG: hypothetical protein A3E31_05495 [Candidatus Rokubacteria bacterium RIFCSPHIGHO2_12_FULL_73_22]|nr:MAG: hypothetical protein A3D33_19720 [Candidatus Rokubacteria bacterium RIFCSPHIGHO2_02_FULL_73_26]OGL04045.1 MAG: hypothetical protein A3E31_05495 [Candidatus Rokubacteria bacterium RIFCSPHIGHO2_12_FULL_73_22]OGL21383.1 MAG: hypothetical protein A3G44_19775 [Candidatus Rokubacteria bacterium RIFCSPLOWO2_12_FULL_73_47]